MKTVKDILDEAVREFNKTMLGRNAEFHKRDTYDERRGIFYNSLRRSFQYSSSKFKFSEKLHPDDVICTFRPDGSLQDFRIPANLSTYSSTSEDLEVMKQIHSLNNLTYLDTEVRVSFDDIKNFQFKF